MAAAQALGARQVAAGLAGAGRMAAWRAHAYGPLAELRLESARVPPLRAPDDVLVRVHHASINPLDVAMIGGYGSRVLNALRALEGQGVEFPLVVGRDFAGEVVAAGAGAAARVGRRVWGVVPAHRPGSHAQYVLVKDRWVGAAPEALEPAAAGGALYAALSACAVLRAAGLPPGAPRAARAPRVLLLGLGGAGHAALQLLVHQGAQVVVGCSRELEAAARAAGAAAVLDRAAPDYDRQLIEAGPYEAIVDCAGLGGDEAAARAWRFGRFATLTSPLLRETDARGLALGAAAAAAALAAQCAALPPAPPAPPTPAACAPRVRWAFFMPSRDDIEMLRRLAERGKLAVRVERVWAWRAARAAYERAAQGRRRGKLLLDFTDDTDDTDHGDHGDEVAA